MTSFYDMLAGLGPWNWVFAGLILIALETIAPGVHLLWFGLSAVLVGVIAFLASALGLGVMFTLPLQLVLFALISILAVFWVRKLARGHGTAGEPALNVRAAQYVGRIAIVEDAITGGRGKVRIGDTLWSAQGTDTAKGTRVRITGTDGTVLLVEPV